MNTMMQSACCAMQQNGFFAFYQTLVEQFTTNLPFCYSEFANRTHRATLPLQSANDALFYNVAYAMGHYQTFLAILEENLMAKEYGTVINIVDYACGQGVATLATLDFIAKQKNISDIHLNIHLIEPSKTALNNAIDCISSLAKRHGFSVKISYQNCKLHQAIVPKFDNENDTFHLMSYMLDIDEVQDSLKYVSKQIGQLTGNHYVIASGINTPNGFNGLNLLSYQLLGYRKTIKRYYTPHYSYHFMSGDYQNLNSQAIGMIIALENEWQEHQAA